MSTRNKYIIRLVDTSIVCGQAVLCAISEMVSMRFVNGVGQRTGLMGIDYPTAGWLYKYVYRNFRNATEIQEKSFSFSHVL